MIDTRFHSFTGPISLPDLLLKSGHADLAKKAGTEVKITGASDLAESKPGTISFIARAAFARKLADAAASVVLVPNGFEHQLAPGTAILHCEDPYGVFIDILNVLYPDDTRRITEATGAYHDENYKLEDNVVIGAGAVVGKGAEIGSGTVIGANAVIGSGVTIGRNCVIGAGSKIECAHLGNEVVLQPGVVIGAEGFGFQLKSNRHKKIPQLGRVIIQDAVEIGANTTVDRGTLSDTVIGEGTKIDNLVQIGHNCRIGRNCVISGMCGLSGSTILEDGVVMGGGAGTAGHMTIGAGTIVLARSGVSHSFPAGSNIGGAPAQDVKMWKREIVALRRLSKEGDKK